MPKYSQHFLINSHAIDRIVDALELQPGDQVLEIGPGKGALTASLLGKGATVVAIEVDESMVTHLQKKFPPTDHFKVLHQDFLEMDLASIPSGLKVVGNLPYNITSPILRRLCEWPGWSMAVVMVQKEVGERLCAVPSTKSYGALTVGVNLNCEIKPVFVLSETSFDPPPKVRSMVVRLDRRAQPLTTDIKFTQRVIQAAFQQRRKTISNSLSHGLDLTKEELQVVFEDLKISPTARAETLTVDQFVHLSRVLKPKTVD